MGMHSRQCRSPEYKLYVVSRICHYNWRILPRKNFRTRQRDEMGTKTLPHLAFPSSCVCFLIKAVIYRKYRDGELPDIQIKLGDVLRPLQHLSMLDGGIAKEVFVEIFKVSEKRASPAIARYKVFPSI